MPTNYTKTMSAIATKVRHCSECDCRWQPTEEINVTAKVCVNLFKPTFDDQEIEKALELNVDQYRKDTNNNVICIECRSIAVEAIDAHFKNGFVSTLKEHYQTRRRDLIQLALIFAAVVVIPRIVMNLLLDINIYLGDLLWIFVMLLFVGFIGFALTFLSLFKIFANASNIEHYINTFSEEDAKEFFVSVIRDKDDCISEEEFSKFVINALMAKK